ncbi:hypothetical protein ABZ590_35295, partial [Streptomyces hirsutus]
GVQLVPAVPGGVADGVLGAGAAGAALCRHALDVRWCVRIGSERAVKVTEEGERALSELLGIEKSALR